MSPQARDPLRHLLPGVRQLEEEVDEEIRLHLELRAAELERQGWSPAAARQEALRRFGDVEASRAACVASDRRRYRSMQRREHLGELAQDLKLAVRQLQKRPLFALAASLTLAVGIGATTAVFSAADHVLLRPLPYAEPARVVTLWETDAATGERHKEVAAGNFFDWQERNRSFSAMGLAEPSGFDLTGDGPPRSTSAWRVTAGFFETLGVEPALGRPFLREEYREGDPPAAVLISDGLWRRRFGAAPGVVGRTIELDGQAVPVVGVLPPQVEYPEAKDLWVPNAFSAEFRERRLSGYLFAVARLRPGTTLAQAQADLDRVARAVAREHPATNRTAGVQLVPLPEQIFHGVRPALVVLLAAVGFLLLIACANVANLLLARGLTRERELAVLAALGAGRQRLTRQLLLESLLLAALGGGAGIGLAFAGVRLLAALVPPGLPRVDDLGLDGRVLAFAAAVTLATVFLFGLAPALRFSRPDLLGALRGGRGTTETRAGRRLRGALVVAEIALALVLLVGAGLLAGSFVRLLASDPGFRVERRASLQLFLWDRNPTIEKRRLRVAEIAARLRSVPGALDVAVVSALPFHPSQIDAKSGVQIEGEARTATEEREAYTTVASPEYFRVLGIPLERGRVFTARDRAETPPVAVINESMARRFFPGEDPVGRRIRVGVMGRPQSREIVGVVGDVRPTALDSPPRPELYVPFEQSGTGSVTFVVRTAGDPAALLPALESAVWEVDRGQTIYHAATLDELVAGTLRERRFNLVLLAAFSAIALALSALGIYGLTSFSVRQRRAEIGIRIALGARPADIVRMVVGEGLRLGGLGVALGLAGAAALTHFLRHMLYGLTPTDAPTYAEMALFMLALTALGAYLPAARATAADPLRALD